MLAGYRWVRVMKLTFWICLGLIAYAYFGYAVLLSVYAKFRRRPVLRQDVTPSVSILMAARNEESRLAAKLENLRNLSYPPDQLQVIVVSDGSTDGTNKLLLGHVPWLSAVILPESGGKANALNQAVLRATGEFLVFLDVRQSVDPNAISELVACFGDPGVGAVSGELLLETATGTPSLDALGIYWAVEKAVRKLESMTGSVVGVTGAIYAIRRELFVTIPPGTVLDDVFVPMNVVRMKKRVVFQPSAVARDRIFAEKRKEFSRKVRTLAGNYQLLRIAPWLLTTQNPLLFRYISHKLLRLLVPLLLVMLLISSAMIAEGPYSAMFGLQIVFYTMAAAGALLPSSKQFKPVAIASTFVMLNAAAALAFYSFVAGRKRLWT